MLPKILEKVKTNTYNIERFNRSEYTSTRKNVAFWCPQKFEGYQDALTALNDTGAIAGAFAYTIRNNNKYLFIAYNVASNQGVFVACWNMTQNVFRGYNIYTGPSGSAGFSCEGLAVKVENETFKIYMNCFSDRALRSGGFTGNGTVISTTAVSPSSIKVWNKMSARNDRWLMRVYDNISASQATNLIITDSSFNILGQITEPRYNVDLLTSYTATDAINHVIPHKQGIALNDNTVVWFAGGSSTGVHNAGEEYIGMEEMYFNGELKRTTVCDADKFMPLLETSLKSRNMKLKGVSSIECEGGFIDENGRIYTCICVFGNGEDGIAVVEECSIEETSFDCSSAFAGYLYGNMLNRLHINPLTSMDGQSHLLNPVTKEPFTNIIDICQFMVTSHIPSITIDKPASYFTLPVKVQKMEILNSNQENNGSLRFELLEGLNTVRLEYTSIDNNIADRSYATYLVYNLGTTTPKIQMESHKVNQFHILGNSNNNEVTNSLKPALYFHNENVNLGDHGCQVFFFTPTKKYSIINSFENTNKDAYLDFGGSGQNPFKAVRIYVNETADNGIQIYQSHIRPYTDNSMALGHGSYRWSNIYCGTTTISTSDERQKTNIEDPSESLMRAWGKVKFKVFKMKDAVEQKGETARKHVGVIAQDIIKAFESEGLNAFEYGLICHDYWEAKKAEYTESGDIVEPAKEAGDIYSVRYEECLALECAYQRWELEKIKSKLN